MPGRLLIDTPAPGVVVLTLSNPAKRNALDLSMCAELTAAFASLPGRGARAAVLRGDPDGRAFCAGFDLDALAAADPVQGDAIFAALLDGLARCPVPVVAALAGAAMGGGCELAAACDQRIAAPGAKLGLPPARLGIVYPTRGLARMSALVGDARARQLFLRARIITAEEAHGWGLVDELCPADLVDARAAAVAGELALLAPLAVQGMRVTFEALLRRRAALEGDDARDVAARREQAWRSADAREALAALAEKRSPTFSGE